MSTWIVLDSRQFLGYDLVVSTTVQDHPRQSNDWRRVMTWGPLHASAFTGSMFGADPICWCVMHYAVAVANSEDVVELNPSLLAPMFNSSKELIENAILYLTSPDPHSRTEAEEGRRLLHLAAFSYLVVNREKYRALIKEEARREYFRDKKREYRDSQRDVQDKSQTPLDSPRMSTNVHSASISISTSTSTSPITEEGTRKDEREGGRDSSPKRKPKKTPPPDDPAFELIWKLHNDYCKELSARGVRASSGKKTEAKAEWFKIPAEKRSRIHSILADQIEADAFNYGSIGIRVRNLSRYLSTQQWDNAVPQKIEEEPQEEHIDWGFRNMVEQLVYMDDEAQAWICEQMGWSEFRETQDQEWMDMPFEKKAELFRAFRNRNSVEGGA